ncbi:hypothetical protein JXA47_10400, partial [Candidatus Sumerlaeota bacterium]|nr:hypothetical protein [Candidatus Sumerlaeota bacterium]
ISGPMDGGDGGGQLIGGHIAIAVHEDQQRTVNMAFDTEHNQFLVVWEDERNIGINDHSYICARRVDAATGALLGSEIEITDASFIAQFPAATYCPPDDSFLVVWSSDNHDTCEAQRVGYNGSLVGSPFEIGAGAQSVQRPAVSYAAGKGRCLVACPLGDDLIGQLVSATRDEGDGGGQLIGSGVTLGEATNFTFADADYIPDIGHWFVAWDHADDTYPLWGCWVDPDGAIVHSDCVLSNGGSVALSHGINSRDTPWMFHSAPITTPDSRRLVYARRLPQLLEGEDECVIERFDFLRVEVRPLWWNMIGALPGSDFSVDLRVYPEALLFSGDPLAESDNQGPGRAEIIAVNGPGVGTETLNLLVEVPQYDRTMLEMEHEVGEVAILGTGDLTDTLDAQENFLISYDLFVIEGQQRVINAIPRDDDLDINLALFEPGAVPADQHIGLEDLPLNRRSYGLNPGQVETLYLVAPASTSMGLAVWTAAGAGEFRLVVRDPEEPTTEELIKYLLGQSGIPWGANVNGDMDGIWPIIDIADVVANIEAGR